MLKDLVLLVCFVSVVLSRHCQEDPQCRQEGNLTETRATLMKLIIESERNCFKSGKCPNKNATTIVGERVNCINGMSGIFPCMNVDMLSVVSITDLGSSSNARGNDIWGWIDPLTNKRYAITGQTDGSSFVDVTDPLNPIVLGFMASNVSPLTTWRDMKVYNNYAYIVADDRLNNHGMQVFDLTRLRNMDGSSGIELIVPDYIYKEFGSCHNIYINEDTGFLYAIGSRTCSGGLHIVNLNFDPQGQFEACYSEDGYTHDTECVIYSGSDNKYIGHEICFAYNEDTLTIVDVSDKQFPFMLSRTGYQNSAYCHQGWLTEDHNYLLMDDELDEIYGRTPGDRSRTMIWDVRSLDNPQLIGDYLSSETAVDHNLYILGNYAYQSNDGAGFRLLDISNIQNGILEEVGYFDAYPEATLPEFEGVWSAYPYYGDNNDFIVIQSRDRGLFVLQPNIN